MSEFNGLRKKPLRKGTGNFFEVAANFCKGTGNFTCQIPKSSPDEVSVHTAAPCSIARRCQTEPLWLGKVLEQMNGHRWWCHAKVGLRGYSGLCTGLIPHTVRGAEPSGKQLAAALI